MKRYVLLFILLVSSVLGMRIAFQGEGLHYVWKRENFWLNKANTHETFDLLVLGDSRLFSAVNPEILKKTTDDKVLNFAFSSISFTEHYLLKADEVLAPKGRVFIGLTAEALTHFEGDQGLSSYEKSGPLFIHQLMKWIRVYWPVINLETLISRGKIPIIQMPPRSGSDFFHTNGWIETKMEATKDYSSMVSSYRGLFQKHKIQESILVNLEKQISAWNKKGVTVYTFWVCFEAAVCQEEEILLGNGNRENINQRLQIAGAKFIPMNDSKYSTFDGDHLIGSEAIRFSEYLKLHQ
jgi:hypothetical protein